MIDLSDICGLPISFDKESATISYDKCVSCSNLDNVSLVSIIPTLLNKYLKYPEYVYSHHRNIVHIDDLAGLNGFSYDIIVVPYGLLGIEYIRTHVYHSQEVEGKYDCIVEVLSGALTVVLQKNEESDDPFSFEKKVDIMKIINLKKGERVAIPTGYYYTFANTSTEPIVFSRVAGGAKEPVDYNSLQKERGLAYYVISKNARTEVVPNPKYSVKNEIELLDLEDVLEEDAFFIAELYEPQRPLYHVFAKQHSFLDALLWVFNWTIIMR